MSGSLTQFPLTDITDASSVTSDCAPSDLTEGISLAAATDAASLLKALADPLRLRMLSHIAQTTAGESCVCDLAALADVSQPTVSHHLKVLRDAGVLTSQRRGTWVWYSMAPAHATSVATLLNSLMAAPSASPAHDGGIPDDTSH
jgi:DNA-binding transcriptional ArsR family regulator